MMISTLSDTQTSSEERGNLTALVDPDCIAYLREWEALPGSDQDMNLLWQVAPSRGGVKDRLLRDKNVRVVLIAAHSDTDPLLRDVARNISQLPTGAWLHVVLLTVGQVPAPLLASLRNFASWSVLAAPCTRADLMAALSSAGRSADEKHRLSRLSEAIRADAEDILTRTRNIVGALSGVDTPSALGDLARIAGQMSHANDDLANRVGGREAGYAGSTSAATHIGVAAYDTYKDGEEAERHWTRKLIDICTSRQNYFPEGLFSDPAWDMLLDLTHARLSRKRVSVSSLCIASRVPATTALRRISDLVSQGLALRVRDEADGRRVFVELTDEGFQRMRLYIENVCGMFMGDDRSRTRSA